MIVEIILVVIFALIGAGDIYSTSKLMRYNYKMANDKKFRIKVLRMSREKLKEDVTRAEMCSIPRKFMQKLGVDRALLYMGVFGYGPICLVLLYLLLTDFNLNFILIVGILGFMVGVLYRQIMKAMVIEKRFGVKL